MQQLTATEYLKIKYKVFKLKLPIFFFIGSFSRERTKMQKILLYYQHYQSMSIYYVNHGNLAIFGSY